MEEKNDISFCRVVSIFTCTVVSILFEEMRIAQIIRGW